VENLAGDRPIITLRGVSKTYRRDTIAVPVLAALAVLAVRRARRHAAEEPTP